jgi:hypothetical protein
VAGHMRHTKHTKNSTHPVRTFGNIDGRLLKVETLHAAYVIWTNQSPMERIPPGLQQNQSEAGEVS